MKKIKTCLPARLSNVASRQIYQTVYKNNLTFKRALFTRKIIFSNFVQI